MCLANVRARAITFSTVIESHNYNVTSFLAYHFECILRMLLHHHIVIILSSLSRPFTFSPLNLITRNIFILSSLKPRVEQNHIHAHTYALLVYLLHIHTIYITSYHIIYHFSIDQSNGVEYDRRTSDTWSEHRIKA